MPKNKNIIKGWAIIDKNYFMALPSKKEVESALRLFKWSEAREIFPVEIHLPKTKTK